jgi:hypothetical protein
MSSSDARLNAVVAALVAVREHIEDIGDDDVSVSTYNRWVGMLDGVVEGNWKSLSLEGDAMPASELLMHVDAAIAFLEGCRSA